MSVFHRRSKLMLHCVGSSSVVLPADFGILMFVARGRSQLFKSMQNSQHCINCLLPDTRNAAYFTSRRNHPYELPHYHYSWSQCSFVNRPLYNFIWCMVFIWYDFELIYNQCPYSHVRTYTFRCDQSVIMCCLSVVSKYEHWTEQNRPISNEKRVNGIVT